MDAQRPSLILNPAAGPLWRRRKARRLIAHIRSLYPSLSVHMTERGGDAERLAASLSSGPSDLIMAAGGDGTFNEVINGMKGSSTPLGILPMGTGNSLVRELGLPVNPFHAASAIRQGDPRPVYLGRIGNRLFALMLGAGFDAWVIGRVSPSNKRWGMLSYVIAGLAGLFTYGYPLISFRVDGKEHLGTSGIIAKGRCYGGPFAVVPEARLDRPELVLCLFTGRGPMTYLRYALGIMGGLHARMKDIRFYKGTEIVIDSSVPLHADGEPVGRGPIRVTIHSAALNMVYPPSRPSGSP